MEGRRIGGEGVDHEQEYVAERLEQAGDVEDYAEAAEQLKRQAQDLQKLTGQGDPAPTQPDPSRSST